MLRRDRSSGRGGGVCFYVRDDLPSSAMSGPTDLEALFLTVSPRVGSTPFLTVGCVYRPPGTACSFWPSLTDFIDDMPLYRF